MGIEIASPFVCASFFCLIVPLAANKSRINATVRRFEYNRSAILAAGAVTAARAQPDGQNPTHKSI